MGTLYICATPIGNLEDASFRLIKTLSTVDVIACEDTRHTQKLLNHFEIRCRTISYHQHNRASRGAELLAMLKEGLSVALVTDAGMPGISDPGADLVEQASNAAIPVLAIPGPSAAVTALAVSGLPIDRFVFEGFLPPKSGQRRTRLEAFRDETRTVVFYEAPHRLLALLLDIDAIFSDRTVVVARELTKVHEEVRRGTAKDLTAHYESHPPKGEITVLLAGAVIVEKTADLETIADEVEVLIEAGVEKKEALKIKAREYGIKKGDLYKLMTQR
ncbi:MAG: 16S rRNA (cytidine(1402)-2'-O)-methyltransferase [Solirubrobacterales bacterium]